MKKCMRQLSWGKLNLWNKSFFLSIIFFVLENFVIFRLAPLVSKKKKKKIGPLKEVSGFATAYFKY